MDENLVHEGGFKEGLQEGSWKTREVYRENGNTSELEGWRHMTQWQWRGRRWGVRWLFIYEEILDMIILIFSDNR